MTPLDGYNDRIGLWLKTQRQIEAGMRELFESYDYEEYLPPMLERAGIYEIGVSSDPTPWIEGTKPIPKSWNKTVEREFQPVVVTDFRGDKPTKKELCILRPEGTASLCRYIAKNVVERSIYPSQFSQLKVYYIIPCFRNEGIENLSKTKQREFNQIGLEYVGATDLDADIEAFYLGYRGINGIMRSGSITARVSDVNIFRNLCDASGYDTATRVRMKESIDALSKSRITGADTGAVKTEVEKYTVNLPADLKKAWSAVYSVMGDETAIAEIEDATGTKLEKLRNFFGGLKDRKVPVIFDSGMIRGWEYYTGLVCQFDVRTAGKNYAEVAGGGRYDTLIGNFLNRYGISGSIPATGFAYGTERLVEIALGERK